MAEHRSRISPARGGGPAAFRAVLVAAGVAMTGCGAAGEPTPESAMIRDSAGITIVDNAERGAWPDGEGWTVEEAVTIGQLDGPPEYTFHRLLPADRALLAAPGEPVLFVLDTGDRIIRVYDREGRYLRAIGGPGDGPGEFRLPMSISARGDSVIVYDSGRRWLSYFGADGRLLRERPLELVLEREGRPPQGPTRVHALPDGYLAIYFGTGCPFGRPDEARVYWTAVAAGTDASPRGTLIHDVDRYFQCVFGETFSAMFPFAPMGQHHLTIRHDGTVAYGRGGLYELSLFRVDWGRTGTETRTFARAPAAPHRIVRRAVPLPPLTRAHRAELYARYTDVSESMVPAYRATLDNLDWPEHWPAFDAVLWDDEAHLWVRRGLPDGDAAEATERSWDIFDPEGLYLGEVLLPATLDIGVVAGRMVWGISRDEFGVQYVKGYRLIGR